MTIYYAHSMHLYDKPQEERDIQLLKSLGFTVYNPNSPGIQVEVEEYRTKHGDENVMDYFKQLLESCDAIAFRAHPDGKIPGGVMFEVNYMKGLSKPIIELPTLTSTRALSVEDTREYLKLLGQR